MLFNHAKTDNGSLNRNVSYGLGVLADKSPEDKFAPHLNNVLLAIKQMHEASSEQDSKDNCVASIARIAEKYQKTMPEAEFNTLFEQIMGAIPLLGDPGENETMLKFIINVNTQSHDKIVPFMDKITLTCLRILTDSESRKLIEDPFRVVTAKFIKHVISED